MRSHRAATAVWSAILFCAGCASVPPPRAQIAKAEIALSNARKERAGVHAPLALYKAQDKLERAQAAMRAERNVRARRLAEQAQLDAETAALEAQRGEAERSAEELARTVEILEEELKP